MKPEIDHSEIKSFNTKNIVVTQSDNLHTICDNVKSEKLVEAQNFQEILRTGLATNIIFGC